MIVCHDLLSSLLASISDAACVTDADGTLIDASPAFRQLLPITGAAQGAADRFDPATVPTPSPANGSALLTSDAESSTLARSCEHDRLAAFACALLSPAGVGEGIEGEMTYPSPLPLPGGPWKVRGRRIAFDTETSGLYVALEEDASARNPQRLDRLIAAIAQSKHILLEEKDVFTALPKVVDTIGEASEGDRCYVFQVHEDAEGERLISQRFEWVRAGIEPQIDNPDLQNIPWPVFLDLFESLAKGVRINGLVREADDVVRETLQAQGVLSFLFMPIMVNGVFWGWIGYDDCTVERQWTEPEIAALFSLANAIGSALNKARLDKILEENYERYQTMLGTFGEALWEWDADRDVFFISREMVELLHFEAEQIPATTAQWGAIVHPEDVARIKAALAETAMEKDHLLMIDSRFRDGNGVYRWMRVRASCTWEGGVLTRMIGTIADVDEQKHTESTLRDTEEQLHRIFTFTNDIAYAYDFQDPATTNIICGEQNLFFRPTGELAENAAFLFDHIHPDDRATFDAAMHQAVATGVFDAQYRIIPPGREPRWVHNRGQVTYDNGAPARMMGLLIDVDDLKRSELMVRALNTDLEGRVLSRTEELRQSNLLLHERETRYRILSELVSDFIYQFKVGADGSITVEEISDSFLDITGYMPFEIEPLRIEGGIYEFHHPDDRPGMNQHFARLLSGHRSSCLYRLRRKDGRQIWIETHARPIWSDEEHTVTRILGLSRDVTEQKTMIIRLEESERKNRAIVEALPDMVFITDRNNVFVDFHTPSLYDLLIPDGSFIGLPIESVLPAHVSSLLAGVIEKVRSHGQLERFDYEIRMPDGPKFYEARVRPYGSDTIISIVRDITESKGHEQRILEINRSLEQRVEERTRALRKSQEQYRLITTHSQDLITIIDADGTFSFVSPSMERIVGHGPGDLPGSRLDELVHVEDRTELARWIADLRGGAGGGKALILRFLHRNGDIVSCEMVGSSLTGEDGSDAGTLIVARDITARLRDEDNLRLQGRMLDQIRDVIIVTDVQGTIIRCNRAALDELGTAENGLVGQSIMVIHPEESRSILHAEVTADLLDSGGMERDVPVLHRSGQIRLYRLRAVLLHDGEGGAPTGFLGYMYDITEQKLAEERLRRSEERYRLISDNMTDVICLHALDGTFQYISPSIVDLLGYSPEELLGGSTLDLLDPDDTASHDLIRVCGGALPEIARTFQLRHKDGREVWVETIMHNHRDADGAITGYQSASRDITERIRYEQELAASEAKYRLISEGTSDIVSIYDLSAGITYISPSVRMLGYEPEELLGWRFDAPTVHLLVDGALNGPITALFEGNKSRVMSTPVMCRNGDVRVLESTISPLFNSGGELSGFNSISRDVTDRERMTRELEVALAREKEVSELQTRFVSTASHQFRTPLTVIQSGMELVEMIMEGAPGTLRQKLFRQTERVKSEVTRMTELMNDILILGRHSARKTVYTPEDLEITAFLDDLIARNFPIGSDGRKVRLVNLQAPTMYRADPKLLSHALVNIISNALKYSDTGDPVVSAACDAQGLRISVTDTGIGIPPEDVVNLFQPFYRGGNTVNFQGSGLGLTIAKEFIEMHGGSIEVSSGSGSTAGTTFTVILPNQEHHHDTDLGH